MSLTHEQVTQLLKPINPLRISKKDNLSHVEAYDVRAHLIRVFGFGGWSEEVTDLAMLYEQSKEEGTQTRWRAAYRATVRLTLHDTEAVYTESAVGTNFGWLPDSKRDETHDMAIKTAASQALKRCAINLGDQFGLSLYQKGSDKAIVGRTLAMPTATAQVVDAATGEPPAVDSHVTEPVAPEHPETSTPPAPPADDGVDHVQAIRDAIVTEAAALPGNKRNTFLLRQIAEIGRLGIGTATVTDGDGNGMSLDTLAMRTIKRHREEAAA